MAIAAARHSAAGIAHLYELNTWHCCRFGPGSFPGTPERLPTSAAPPSEKRSPHRRHKIPCGGDGLREESMNQFTIVSADRHVLLEREPGDAVSLAAMPHR